MIPDYDELKKAARILADAQRVVVLTGAGISRESGIPTFREAQTGLWAQYEPEKLATREGFSNDPNLVWTWYDWRRKMVSNVTPNAGHFALAELERLVPKFVLLTQNVDGLHRKAGSNSMIEIHGNISRHKCFDNEHPVNDVQFDLEQPPRCHCGSLVRPDVVWFGEALNPEHLTQSFEQSRNARVFIVIGTSGLVQPAASFPFEAKRRGAQVIECNTEETPITDIADVFLQGPSGEILPLLIEEMKKIKIAAN